MEEDVEEETEYETAVDLSTVEAPSADYTESNQLPLTGYFKSSLTGDYADREVRYYIPDTATIRPYYHFIAVPDDVDVDEFLVESGWKQVADETGECLYLLLPDQSTGKWGDVEEEKEYIAAAKSFHTSNTAYFTTFGEFYLVGYEEGAAALEAWASENPQFVISQAYIGGESYGTEGLEEAGATSYGWQQMTDGDIRDRDGDGVNERLDSDGNQKILYQMASRLTEILNADMGEYAGLLTKGDMPVPTWLINRSEDESVDYWKSVNKTVEFGGSVSSLGGIAVSGAVYVQDEDTWATEYAGQISKVTDIDTDADTMSYEFTRALRDEMTYYTRYDNTISYGNALMLRVDYTAIQVEAYSSEDTYATGTVYGETLDGDVVAGELTITQMTTSDGYVTDVLLYVPETAGDEDIPVVVVYHGGSQTGQLFFDSTSWWQTAAEEGFAIIFPTRTNHQSGTTSDYDATIFDVLQEYLEADGRFDMTRIYSTGQSMGSVATITLAEERTSELAAVISSNAGGPSTLSGGDPIPAGLVVGEGNYADRGIPGYTADTSYEEDETEALVRSTEAAAAGADIYWDASVNLLGASMHNMNDWITYFLDANGLDEDSLSDVVVYSGASSLNGGYNDENGSLSDWNTNNARYRTFTWYNEDDIPIMEYVFALYQAHNCQPGYRALMWDFLEHYSVEEQEDGTLIRYYSESAFEEDDKVVIAVVEAEEDETVEAEDLDDIESLDIDWSQAAQLPLTGYFTKTVTEDGRTVKVYISDEASVRSYFTVVAVPDGVDTYEFLEENGYFELADEKGECLYILEPGEDGWGSAEDEAEYVSAAMSFLKSPSNANSVTVFSTYGIFYLVGYGDGAAALELWAAANPLYVISQTYIDGESAGTETLSATAEAVSYGGSTSYGDISDVLADTIEAVGIDGEISAIDVPIPTYLINYSGSEEYWQTVNDCIATGTEAGVYYQDIESDAYATEYANGKLEEAGEEYGISQVVISTESADAAEIYEFLSIYTRYDNSFAYSNYIAYRLDYTEARVAAQEEAQDCTVKETLSDGTEIWGAADTYIEGHGTVQVGVIAFSDNSGDGEVDPREYILFVPEGYEAEDLPVVFVFAGNSQTDSIFFDCTLWWQIAEEEGIVLAVVCETYSTTVKGSNACSVSHTDTDLFYDAMMTILEEKIDGDYAKLDFSRVYATGQSSGSVLSQGFAVTDPDMFAAVASTSATPLNVDDTDATPWSVDLEEASYESIPTLLITGQMDQEDLADGFDSVHLQVWGTYMLEANGLTGEFSADTATSVLSIDSRHQLLYSWNLEIEGESVPMVQWAQCLLRAHNFYPSDIDVLWDFLEHYSYVTNADGTVTRYYSASAFAEDDQIEITLSSEDDINGTEESTEAVEESTTAAEDTTMAAEDTTTASSETTEATASTTAASTTTSAATTSASSSSGSSTGDSSSTLIYVVVLLAALGAACICGGVVLKKRR